MRLFALASLFAALSVSPTAEAGTLAGVTMPDSITVGGEGLVLNGMGLREKYFIDVYVGGLYLPAASTDAATIIMDDVPKRIILHFVYSQVGADKLIDAWEDGFEAQGSPAALRPKYDQLAGMMNDVSSGEEIVFDYVPGTGLSVTVAGANRGTITGTSFMQSFVAVFVGTSPPTAKLKRGMLGR